MCKSSELKKFNEYFNVLIFGSLDLKNIDLEMAIRQEWKYVINLITFTGMGPSTYVYVISDFLDHFWPTYLPISDFLPNLDPFLLVLHRWYPIFLNLPTYQKIGYHMWMAPYWSTKSKSSNWTLAAFCVGYLVQFLNLQMSCYYCPEMEKDVKKLSSCLRFSIF